MSSIELRGESRREIKFTDNGNNTCEIHISGPFASTAYALLDGGEMRRLQNWLTTHIGVPDQSPEPPASDEPARCEHGFTSWHWVVELDPVMNREWRCPGPAASGTPDGGS